MVAVLVLALGLLGMAGLQASSIRNNHSAFMRSQATFLAYDIIDRMRVNRPTALGGATSPYELVLTATPATPANCNTTACSTAALANFDLFEWTQTLANKLTSGDGSVTRLTVGGRTIFRVIVQWDDSRGASGASNNQVQVEAEL
jgi:type IV pilus assembly protein PilV